MLKMDFQHGPRFSSENDFMEGRYGFCPPWARVVI